MVEFDEIIVGSGLTALAVALGLDKRKKVLVLTGSPSNEVVTYGHNTNTPLFFDGFGGLGNFWHGVIPLHETKRNSDTSFEHLFKYFYKDVEISSKIGTNTLFVPRRPIRPQTFWKRLEPDLVLCHEKVSKIQQNSRRLVVRTSAGNVFQTKRIWLAAGAIGTPNLLYHSFGEPFAHNFASDHFICYLGQIERDNVPHYFQNAVKFSRGGYFINAQLQNNALLTVKPARFDYRILDKGIEQRQVFGLPTGNAISKIFQSTSFGLISEALFNKFGLFGDSDIYSVYGQFRVKDAYDFDVINRGVCLRQQNVLQTISKIRDELAITGLRRSNRPDLFIRGIHVHGTIREENIQDKRIKVGNSEINIVDASATRNIGSLHHSFGMMVDAFHRAINS
jgi:hypothetical protein